jgi:membrane carboxypeptidase/penicillin-binding protein
MKHVKKLPVVAPLALILTVALLYGQSVSAASNLSSSKGKKTASSKSKAGSKGKRGKSTTAKRGKGKGGGNVARATGGRNSRRGRSRAIYLARVRAIQAHDAALRNIAASNILNDNAAGEDPEIRRAAVNALAGRSGTVVVMDPNNGRILAVVNQRMALSSPVKPCSTVKLIVGLGALHEGVFDPNQDVQLAGNGYSLNLTDALAHSNNLFFQVLGRRLGFARVMKYAENFGFGQVTGANYGLESPGFLPEEGEEETGHMSSHGDGFGLTAMQLATFTSAIANGGNLYVPHAPRTPEENVDFKPILRRKLDFSAEDRLRMLSGMIGAVNFGTAKLAYDPIGQVAGKTGTCTDHDKLGLFTSFSSINNPKLVVTVITTGSSEAGKRAAEVAGRVYRSISARYLREAPVVPAAALIELPTR